MVPSSVLDTALAASTSIDPLTLRSAARALRYIRVDTLGIRMGSLARRAMGDAAAQLDAAATEIERLGLERDAHRAIHDGPHCDACDSDVATNTTADGFRCCDEHRSPHSVDLPYAEALRGILREVES